MTTICIVYASTYGNTEKLAHQVAEGAKSVPGTTVILKKSTETTKEDLLQADGIIFGSPVHMGSMDSSMKTFIDTVCSALWMKDKLVGRVGGVFVTGSGFGNAGGGCELTMLSMLTNFAELGMILVPLPKNTPHYAQGGHQFGPYARSANVNMENITPSKESLEVGFYHGANIARIAAATKNKKLFA